MTRLNELTYIFPLALGANPDTFTRDFCRAMYSHPMTWLERAKVRAHVHEVIAELEADVLCWIEMRRQGRMA